MITVPVQGLKELQDKLLSLRLNVAKNAVRRATAAGGRVIRDIMRRNAPRASGESVKTIVVRTRVDPSAGLFVAKIGPSARFRPTAEQRTAAGRKGRKAKGSVRPTAMRLLWATYGTKPHEIVPSGAKALNIGGKYRARAAHPGEKANDFIARSGEEGFAPAVEAFRESLQQSIDEAVR